MAGVYSSYADDAKNSVLTYGTVDENVARSFDDLIVY